MITIHALSSMGEGIGTLPNDRLKIFVDGTLPQEKAEIEISELKKNYAKGRLISLATPSPDRISPPCPYFGQCGGCQIMHLSYPGQLQIKRERVIEALKRIGHLEYPQVRPCLPSPTSFNYRNKIQLPVKWTGTTKEIGLYRKESHDLIPIEHCLIQSQIGEEILTLLHQKLQQTSVRYILIRTAFFTQEALVIFITDGSQTQELEHLGKELMKSHPFIKGVLENVNQREDNIILGKSFKSLIGRPYIYEKLLGMTFKISPDAFFQINPLQTEHLYKTALEFANLNDQEIVVDAYCGVGTLALLAAPRAKQSIGIECVARAIEDAQTNASLNSSQNCTFYLGFAEKRLDLLKGADCIFLNPPRKGCSPDLLKVVNSKKIVYISCDPATLARDLALLSSQYQIDAVQPLDMFPQTMHVETVVKLSLKPSQS